MQTLYSYSISLSFSMLFFPRTPSCSVQRFSEEKSEFNSHYHQLMLLRAEDDKCCRLDGETAVYVSKDPK